MHLHTMIPKLIGDIILSQIKTSIIELPIGPEVKSLVVLVQLMLWLILEV